VKTSFSKEAAIDMKRILLVVGCCLFFIGTQVAQNLPRDPMLLWPGGAPGALGKEDKDIPTLTPYFPNPSKATGAAMIICPGGGYRALAPHEGRDYALWLNEQGIAGFVLKYRLGSGGYRHPAMLQDAARALRMVRSKALEWGLDSKRIGIMGSSAGGHLASTLLTHFDSGDSGASDPIDREPSRPSLGILIYPVITLSPPYAHVGSRNSLLGENPPAELVELLSSEKQVTKETPPTFLFHSVEDSGVPLENSMNFAAALRRNGVPFALHIYPKGRHGIGLGTAQWDPDARHPWTTQCAFWLKEQGFAR
jgi:acetyl esterase/lipase